MKLILIALMVVAAIARPYQGTYEIFETGPAVPSAWSLKMNSQVNSSQPFKLRIHLKNKNMDSLHQTIMNVSTPNHPSYGKHLTRQQVNDMIAPQQESFDGVMKLLKSYGIENKSSIQSDWIIVDGTIGDAEKLLQTKYQIYQHGETGKSTARTSNYSLPSNLHAHVDMISPTIVFSNPASPRLQELQASASDVDRRAAASQCNETITPACIKNLYNIGSFQGTHNTNNTFGVVGLLGEWIQQTDLDLFMKTFEGVSGGVNFSTIDIAGGTNPQNGVAGGEASLDMDYAVSLSYPTPVTFYSTLGDKSASAEDPMVALLHGLLAQEKMPNTMSMSYGLEEAGVSSSYAYKLCNLFGQVAARGGSFLVSTGDQGTTGNCIDPPGDSVFKANFPSSCPFLTSIGATKQIEPEVAWPDSSGGFSNFFSRPAYQAAAATKYLSTHANPALKKYYNATGRGYPDVSAQGSLFAVVANGSVSTWSGTSASTPTFAAIIALLNGDRLAHGLSPLGFLNPWLYNNAANMLNDVVGGAQGSCNDPTSGITGFAATPGWDPVTGLGTPDFGKMRMKSTGISTPETPTSVNPGNATDNTTGNPTPPGPAVTGNSTNATGTLSAYKYTAVVPLAWIALVLTFGPF
jgi:tripeptidyl-peptidase-1